MRTLYRLLELLRVKLNALLSRKEDPREALDDSYERQLDLLRGVRRAIVDVAAARKRIELQANEMAARHRELEGKAQEAVRQGRDDLAREALNRRLSLEGQVATLRQQYASLEAEEKKLVASQDSLASRVQAFRIEKETLKASYSASSARVEANEAVAGIGDQMGEVGRSLERAREQIAQIEARAGATDELLDRGVLADVTGPADSDLDRQLGGTRSASEVERQLAAIKAQLPGGEEPRAVDDRGGRPGELPDPSRDR